MRKPFEISTGAWWIVPDGRTIGISSFHESWLASHPAIAGGALHTVDFVQKSGWLSVTLYSEGMLEVISRDVLDTRQREALRKLLEVNEGAIKKLVVFVPVIDGCLTVEHPRMENWGQLSMDLDAFAGKGA